MALQRQERQEAWQRARVGWFHTVRGYANVRRLQQVYKFPWESGMAVEELRELKNRVKNDKRFPKYIDGRTRHSS